MAVNAAGDIFVADSLNNRVVETDPTGTQVLRSIAGLGVTQGVALDAAGDILVTAEVSSAGVNQGELLEVKPGATSPVTLVSGLNYPNGVAVDNSGNIFVDDSGNNRVLELIPGATSPVTLVSGLNFPVGLAVDGLGNVFIADTLNSRVMKVTAGLTIRVAGSTSTTLSASAATTLLGQPEAFTATITTPSGTAPTDGTVTFYDGTTVLATASLSGSSTVTLYTPALGLGVHQVTASYSGDAYFAGSRSGVEKTSVQSDVLTGVLNFPVGVAVDGSGDLFIADTYNNRVLEETYSFGQGGAVYSSPVPVVTGLNGPRAVAMDGSGDIFIADSGNNRVVEATRTLSQGVVTYGSPVAVVTGLNYPGAVALDGSGDVFVADSGNNRVVEAKPP